MHQSSPSRQRREQLVSRIILQGGHRRSRLFAPTVLAAAELEAQHRREVLPKEDPGPPAAGGETGTPEAATAVTVTAVDGEATQVSLVAAVAGRDGTRLPMAARHALEAEEGGDTGLDGVAASVRHLPLPTDFLPPCFLLELFALIYARFVRLRFCAFQLLHVPLISSFGLLVFLGHRMHAVSPNFDQAIQHGQQCCFCSSKLGCGVTDFLSPTYDTRKPVYSAGYSMLPAGKRA
jgi:hypothetical protein